MTATAVPTTTTNDSFLRFAMRLDAICTGLGGVALAAAAAPLSSYTGLPLAAEYGLAAFFVVYGVTVFTLSRRDSVRAPGTWVIAANLLFTLASVAAVLTGLWSPTTAGVVFLLAGGVYTLVMADLQYIGLRRMR
ncbi:hypothetical protein [Mycolicibacterium sediminis]|nr:hypothetical protein [Mycolicibacterium sediminis]